MTSPRAVRCPVPLLPQDRAPTVAATWIVVQRGRVLGHVTADTYITAPGMP